MSDTPAEFDLKFLPDWLKEGQAGNRYADYEGDTDSPRDRGRDGRDGRRGGGGPGRGPGGGPGRGPGGGPGRGPGGPGRGPGGGPGRGPGGGPGRGPGGGPGAGPRGPGGGNRPSGPGGSSGPGGPRRDDRGPRRDGGRGPQGGDRRQDDRGDRRDQAPPAPLLKIKVEFHPDPNGAAGIAKEIKSRNRAYPLFGTAKLFLDAPERHRVKLVAEEEGLCFFQIGNGPLSLDRGTAEKAAFQAMKGEYYKEEVTQGELPKGNFTNVARLRGSGLMLGPTNHHAYQSALRRIYEERFSRRMSFPEFQQREVEVVNTEQAINDWKEQARSSSSYVTLKEETQLSFKTEAEAEAHFRQAYVPEMLKTGSEVEVPGSSVRDGDRRVLEVVRIAWEKERAFPVNVVNLLRPYMQQAGLHFFKHKKRVLYISGVKPQRLQPGQAFAPGTASILRFIEKHQGCKRPQLAAAILGPNHEAPESLEKKAQLASDLHYLVVSGHVIEFHDGTIAFPLPPKGQEGAPSIAPEAEAEQTAILEAEEAAQSEESGETAEGTEIAEGTAEDTDSVIAIEETVSIGDETPATSAEIAPDATPESVVENGETTASVESESSEAAAPAFPQLESLAETTLAADSSEVVAEPVAESTEVAAGESTPEEVAAVAGIAEIIANEAVSPAEGGQMVNNPADGGYYSPPQFPLY